MEFRLFFYGAWYTRIHQKMKYVKFMLWKEIEKLRGAFIQMEMVVGNGIGEPSSNPCRNMFFSQRKGMNAPVIPYSYRLIDRLGSLALLSQLNFDKDDHEFKLTTIYLKTGLISRLDPDGVVG